MSRNLHNLLLPAALALLTTCQASGMVVPPSVDGAIPMAYVPAAVVPPSAFSLQSSAFPTWPALKTSYFRESCANDPVNLTDPLGLADRTVSADGNMIVWSSGGWVLSIQKKDASGNWVETRSLNGSLPVGGISVSDVGMMASEGAYGVLRTPRVLAEGFIGSGKALGSFSYAYVNNAQDASYNLVGQAVDAAANLPAMAAKLASDPKAIGTAVGLWGMGKATQVLRAGEEAQESLGLTRNAAQTGSGVVPPVQIQKFFPDAAPTAPPVQIQDFFGAKNTEDILVLGRGPLSRLENLAGQQGGRVSTINSTVPKEIFKRNYRDIRSADKIIQYMNNIPTTLEESLQIGGQYSRAEVYMINQRRDLLGKTIRLYENAPAGR